VHARVSRSVFSSFSIIVLAAFVITAESTLQIEHRVSTCFLNVFYGRREVLTLFRETVSYLIKGSRRCKGGHTQKIQGKPFNLVTTSGTPWLLTW